LNGNYTIVNQTQNGYTFNYEVTQTYNSCRATGGGAVYTFNGTGLTLDYDLTYSANPLLYDLDWSETGTINWSGGGSSGSCPVNINLNYTYNGATWTYDYSGTFCGVSIT